MADCKFTLGQSRVPEHEGEQFTVSMKPPLPVGCRFTVSIDGQEVKPGDRVGDLKVVGFGAAGTADFEALRDRPVGKVSITVQCEGPRLVARRPRASKLGARRTCGNVSGRSERGSATGKRTAGKTARSENGINDIINC
jgi:hypothetical protein